MKLKRKVSRLKLPHSKHTAGVASVPVAPPEEVLIPMSMHSGGPAIPVVAVGDHVFLGQLIAREDGAISSPVYASVSGTVSAIESIKLSSSGRRMDAIRIKSDGKMEKDPNITLPEAHDLDSFLAAVQKSGIVGLGGAAFPLWKKLEAARNNPVHTVLVNGAECEPFITSDHREMLEHSESIAKGVELLREYLKAEEFIFGIENNKPDAIEHLQKVFAVDPSVKIMPLESVYPQGARQVLLYNATGKVVQPGQRLASLGVIVINVTSLSKMGQYFIDGMPLVDRCVTVDGSAIKNPGNYVAPIGTSVGYLIEQAGGFNCPAGKVIIGGPMMGKTTVDLNEPIVKATGAVLAFNEKDSAQMEPTACLRCGRCVENCPVGLDPTAFARALEIEDEAEKVAALDKAHIKNCMECGCCSYVCPAHRPLVQNNREGLALSKKAARAKKEGGK